MPHLFVDYAPAVENSTDMADLCHALRDALIASEIFPLAGIRVRALRADHCIVADGHPDNAYVAMTLSVGAGRDTETLRRAGDLVFACAQQALAPLLAIPHFALSLEIREINPKLSWKDTPLHKRLST